MALMTNLSRAFTLINSSKKTMVVIKVQCLIKMQRKYIEIMTSGQKIRLKC